MSHHKKFTPDELAAMPQVIFNPRMWHSLLHSMTDADKDMVFTRTEAYARGAMKWIRGNLRVTIYPTKSKNIFTMSVTVYDCFNVYFRIRVEFILLSSFEALAYSTKLGSFTNAQEIQLLDFSIREDRTVEDLEHELTLVVLTKGH